MAKGFSTTIKDKGYKKAISSFKELSKKPSVKIGVLEKSGEHKSLENSEALTVVEVATFNEFGTETIPERSFIRSTVDQNFEDYVEKSRTLQNKIIMQELDVKKALSILGEKIQADIVSAINNGIEPENSPKTIAAKGSSKPLIDSGQLKQSIKYQVENT